MEIIKNPNFDFLGKAKYFVALSIVLIIGRARVDRDRPPPLRRRVLGGHAAHPALPERRPRSTRSATRSTKVVAGRRHPDLRRRRRTTRSSCASRRRRRSRTSTPPRARVREALAASYGQNPILESSSEIVGPIVGAELRQKAILLTVLGLLFQLIYIAARFKGGVWGVGGDDRRPPRRPHLPRLPRLLQVRDHAERHRRAPHPRRLQRERHDRHLRPRAREPPAPPQGPAREDPQRLDEPDPDPDDHLERHDVPRRARPLPLRRRGAPRASASRWSSASSSGPTRRCSSRCPIVTGGTAQGRQESRWLPRPRWPRRRSPRR